MARMKITGLLFVTLLLLGNSLDCFSASEMDQQMMKCCGSMPCSPAMKSHECCKTMVSQGHPAYLLPHASPSLSLPMIAGFVFPAHGLFNASTDFARLFTRRDHAPPGPLLALQLPLLI
jgi:hypothetical protein